MPKLNVKFTGDFNYSREDLLKSINNILESNTLLALSSINGNNSYINTVFYAYNSKLELYFLTEHSTIHAQNIEINSSIAAAIWIDSGIYGENLQGIQLFGYCTKVPPIKMIDALNNYNKRFPTFSNLIKHPEDFSRGVVKSRLYVIVIEKIKLIDEPAFGRRNYILLTINK